MGADYPLLDLHYILQIVMGWDDDHLHQFRIHGKRYGIPRMGGIWFQLSNNNESISAISPVGCGTTYCIHIHIDIQSLHWHTQLHKKQCPVFLYRRLKRTEIS
jgi:hypothetical protein